MTSNDARRLALLWCSALDRARAGHDPSDEEHAAAELGDVRAQILVAAHEYASGCVCPCLDKHPAGWTTVLERAPLEHMNGEHG